MRESSSSSSKTGPATNSFVEPKELHELDETGEAEIDPSPSHPKGSGRPTLVAEAPRRAVLSGRRACSGWWD